MTRTARSAVIVSLSAGLTTVALWGVPDALRAAGAVPLALVLPGHALVTALFPRWLPWLDRIALAVAISIVVCVLGGFALHWSPAGLTSESWILFLVLTSVAAYFAAWLRWRAGGPSVASPRSRASFHTARREALFVVQAVALAAVALGIARTPLPAKDVSGYTALSLLPAGSGSSRIGVEITSAELRKTQYRLELHVGGWRVYSQRLALAPGERWRAASDIAPIPRGRRSVEALLYRESKTASAYRRATLVLPGSTVPPRTMIWLLWVDSETVRLGMTSAEARTASFRLELYARGRLERLARVRIAPGERWDVHLDLSSIPLRRRSFLAAELYRQGEFRRNRPYRRVTLAPPGGGLLTLEQAGASP